MDIFEGGPRGKFFEISFAKGPTSVRNETSQALIARERTCEARGISKREIENPSRKIEIARRSE